MIKSPNRPSESSSMPTLGDLRRASVFRSLRNDGGVRNKQLLADRKGALVGRFTTTFYNVRAWVSQIFKVSCFISSTFTDTQLERDMLMNEVLNILREKAEALNVEVAFVDMRWGVRDENTIDHRTWVECKREILRCLEESWGVFFISLQGEK